MTDDLLYQTQVEATHAMACEIIDVINKHIQLHGANDPAMDTITLTAMALVVKIIKEKSPRFGLHLAVMLREDEL